MVLHKILGFIVKRWPYFLLSLGLAVSGYMQRHSPRHPDPASGHVFAVITPRRRHTLYLTNSERSLYHASLIVTFASTLGIIGHAMIRKSNRATSLD